MVTKAPNPAGALAAALALAAVASLGACGQRATPSPAFEPSPADARSPELAGAPEAEPTPAPPAEEPPPPPPPPPAATSLPPPEAAPPPPVPPPPAPRGGDEVIYDLGPVTPATAPPPKTRVERPGAATRGERPHRMARAEPPVSGRPPRPEPKPRANPLARPAAPSAPAPAASRAAAAPTRAPARDPAARVQAPPPAPKAKPLSAKASKPAKGTKAAKGKLPADPDRGAKLQALQTALRDAVTRRAELSAPDRPPAGQPSDVTLTLPADFAKTVRDEAAKAGLADAAATVNLTAQLTGEDYAITPGETQAQPLTVGQPTEFHWTATAQPNAKGPLRADVGADLLGAGSESLTLGAVTRSDGGGLRLSSRVWGAGLLLLIALIVVAWLSRGNRSPARRDAARRSAARSRNGLSGDRPLDMTRTPFDRPTNGPRSLDDTQVNGERRDPTDPPR